MINNLQEFIEARGLGEKDFSEVKKITKKFTCCSAWIDQDQQKISVGWEMGAYGLDTNTKELNYPFKIEDFWTVLDNIEKEVEQIWRDTHGCEDCDIVSKLHGGLHAINPDCKSCEGEGIIL